MVLCRCGVVSLWCFLMLHCVVVLWCCGIVMLYCGVVVLCHCGVVALWRCGVGALGSRGVIGVLLRCWGVVEMGCQGVGVPECCWGVGVLLGASGCCCVTAMLCHHVAVSL